MSFNVSCETFIWFSQSQRSCESTEAATFKSKSFYRKNCYVGSMNNSISANAYNRILNTDPLPPLPMLKAEFLPAFPSHLRDPP